MSALLLQGGCDHQVTVADGLAHRCAGLDGHGGVSFGVHERAGHFFFAGEEPPGPADRAVPGDVDSAVVAEIARRIAAERL